METNKVELQDSEARIRAAYDALSESQKRVAEFALTHAAEAAYLPAARIAELVGVSHSTVVRTAQALEFAGFPEFQAALQQRLLERMSTADRFEWDAKLFAEETIQQPGDDEASVLHRVMLTDASHIVTVAQQIPAADFDRAVEMLKGARRVYVVGSYTTAPLALSFGAVLGHIRPNCHVLQPGLGDLPDRLIEISQDDLLVGLSFARYGRDTLRCMDYARGVGARVLTVTDTPLSPAARRADLVLVVPLHRQVFIVAARLSLLNALLIGVAMGHQDDTRRRLEDLDQIHRRFEIFESHDGGDVLS